MKNLIMIFCLILVVPIITKSQTFTAIDVYNTATGSGTGFIDFDNDGYQDLIQIGGNGNKLWRNNGNDNFTEFDAGEFSELMQISIGFSCADYDNDGDLDIYLANGPSELNPQYGSILWRNDGNSNYSMATEGVIGAENDYFSFSGIWSDYDNDGFVDLFLPTGTSGLFPNTNYKNLLFHNIGNGTFSRDTISAIVNEAFDHYKTATWSDYDQDGDLDLSIGVFNQFTAEESYCYFYINQLIETGEAEFIRDTESPYANEQMQAMNIRWIDFDNDGDLDMYAINAGRGSGNTYGPGTTNTLYKNEGNSQFVKITDLQITQDIGQFNAQMWEDFDNDGDLDLYLATQASGPPWFDQGANMYYRNSGYPDYTFTKIENINIASPGNTCYGFANADYDNDGDIDLFVSYFTVQGAVKNDMLYSNNTDGQKNWIGIKCLGSKTNSPNSAGSNKSAIGTKVRLKASINGVSYWQIREIASNDGLLEQSDMRVHFGLDGALQADSIIIEWPSGIIESYSDIESNEYYIANEGEGVLDPIITSVDNNESKNILSKIRLSENFPNPFNHSTSINYRLTSKAFVKLQIYNESGRLLRTIVNNNQQAGDYVVQWNGTDMNGNALSSGVYIYKLSVDNISERRKMYLLR
ncbi:T9SS type A sorting domain-containing protein [Lentimicrobium sp. L6]|uniref:FG-GAP-like repeat-containing protein n=1 Tax=Lentimicrobium sp. L6 TaxID=2735916 RepID=UPI001551A06C|nr:FG-GAP-like repeat-containing protein [Lentimicrobium sp. L6]NPD85464.1 T9SS type A sorting domain-containing protein [Lentimicrobium sp. L6]